MVVPADELLERRRVAHQKGEPPRLPRDTIAPQVAAPRKDVAPAVAQRDATSEISTAAPSVPVEQIIKQFAAREEEFRKERDNYTYTQTFSVQTIDSDGLPSGEQRMTSEILFTPGGKRSEKVTYAPQSTLCQGGIPL